MYDCWRTNPNERPSFRQIYEELKVFLNDMTDAVAEIVLEGNDGVGQDDGQYMRSQLYSWK